MSEAQANKDEASNRWPSITFTCKNCGEVVTTKPGGNDRRTVFCSKHCEKQYWRHTRYREQRKLARQQLSAERSVELNVKVKGWNPVGIPSLAEGQTADGSNQRFEARRRCPTCGKEFIAPTPNRVFCTTQCGAAYYRQFGKHGFPIKRFTCDLPGCSNTVITNGDDDRRYRFCCFEHARKFWDNPPRNSPYKNQKWHSVEEYASWERRTNGE